MISTANPPILGNVLLTELATSGTFPDPAVFIYGVLGAVALLSLTLAYLIFGRSAERTPRSRVVASGVAPLA